MNNKIPPPIVTLTFGLTIYFSEPLFPNLGNAIFNILSLIILILGIITLASAVSSFKEHKTTINPIAIDKASSLVVTGAFKYSRNPMYLGMVFFLLALTAAFNLIGGILLTFLFACFITKFQIIPEEAVMKEIFGEEFNDYKQKTRRWL